MGSSGSARKMSPSKVQTLLAVITSPNSNLTTRRKTMGVRHRQHLSAALQPGAAPSKHGSLFLFTATPRAPALATTQNQP